jgi:hypothetical protein
MSRPDRTGRINNDDARGQSQSEPEAPVLENPKSSAIAFSEASGVAMAAILHLLRLTSAELVLLRGLDMQLFEEAVRKKLGEFTSPTTNQKAREAGTAFARDLIEQVLVQVRAQAELKKRLSGAQHSSEPEGSSATPPQSTLLH